MQAQKKEILKSFSLNSEKEKKQVAFVLYIAHRSYIKISNIKHLYIYRMKNWNKIIVIW